MQRIDGSYLYQLGAAVHPLSEFRGEADFSPTPYVNALAPLLEAERQLDVFLHQSVYTIRYAAQSGEVLLWWVRHIKNKILTSDDFVKLVLEEQDTVGIRNALATFETNLAAEFGQIDTYLIMRKGAFDTSQLILGGISFMPSDLAAKVPVAVYDVNEAMKCLAYEVFTAVGFHIHRANEAVLHRYWDVITKGQERPNHRDIGTYLRELDKLKLGETRVKTALRDLKDLHRNPLIHPDQSLETADEAIDLLSAVRAVVGQMLKEIPAPIPTGPDLVAVPDDEDS